MPPMHQSRARPHPGGVTRRTSGGTPDRTETDSRTRPGTPFNDIATISPRPLLFITGDQAHSKEFSEDAYKRAAEPKELIWVKTIQ
jgi:fermentation-respiration switch protein FrsA (DUF1100 family)